MLTLIMSFGILALSLLLRLAHKLRLTLPLLYAVLVPTIFRRWHLTHPALAAYLFCALLAAIAGGVDAKPEKITQANTITQPSRQMEA